MIKIGVVEFSTPHIKMEIPDKMSVYGEMKNTSDKLLEVSFNICLWDPPEDAKDEKFVIHKVLLPNSITGYSDSISGSKFYLTALVDEVTANPKFENVHIHPAGQPPDNSQKIGFKGRA